MLREFDELFANPVFRPPVKDMFKRFLKEKLEEQEDKCINGFNIKNGSYEWILYGGHEFVLKKKLEEQQKINNEVLAGKCDEMDKIAQTHKSELLEARVEEQEKSHSAKAYRLQIKLLSEAHKKEILEVRIESFSKALDMGAEETYEQISKLKSQRLNKDG